MTTIRDCRHEDLEAVRALNESAVPAMNSLTLDDLSWFASRIPRML